MIKREELPVVVVSFPRSGTHWLCSLMYQWFFWGRLEPARMNDAGPLAFQSWNGSGLCPWMHLFGGHYYDPELGQGTALRKNKKTIYLVRDVRQIMASAWRMLCVLKRHNGDTSVPNFREYISTTTNFAPWESDLNPVPKGLTVYEMCKWSQEKWLREDVFIVTYDQIIHNLDGVRDSLSMVLGIEAQPLHFPADRRVGYVVPPGDRTVDELWETVV